MQPAGAQAVQQAPLLSNVRVDAGALGAPGAAAVQAGQTVQRGAEVLARYALEKQDHVNRGILAREETLRMETAAGISQFFEANQEKPETWGEVSNKAWAEYEKGRETRMKAEKWGTDVAQRDGLQMADFREKFGVRSRAEQDKAYVRVSNARLEANAEQKLRAGDYEGFVASMEKINASPEMKGRKIREGLEVGLAKVAGNQLDALRDLPPAKAIPAINAFIANLTAKDEATGRFADYETEKGGLTLGARQQLEATARLRIREQERAMAVTGRAAVAQIRVGRMDPDAFMGLVEKGEMTPDVARELMPEMAQAVQEWEEKQAGREEAARRREQERQQALASRAETVRTLAIERKRLGLRDIDRHVALGEITKEAGEQIKEELIQASRMEMLMEDGAYDVIHAKIVGDLGARMFGRQPEEEEYQKIFRLIQASAKELTKETRLKLMDEFFTLKLADMADLKEEAEPGRWLDRTLTTDERALRKDMIDEYTRLLPALGPDGAGALLLSQEASIRAFFDGAKDGKPSTAEIEAFRTTLAKEAQKAAGEQALEDLWK